MDSSRHEEGLGLGKPEGNPAAFKDHREEEGTLRKLRVLGRKGCGSDKI